MTGQYNRVCRLIIRVVVIDIRVNISKHDMIITNETVSVYNSQIHPHYCIRGKKLELNYPRHVSMAEGQMSFHIQSVNRKHNY